LVCMVVSLPYTPQVSVILEDGAPFHVLDILKMGEQQWRLRGADCCDGSCGPPHPGCGGTIPAAQRCVTFCAEACGDCGVESCSVEWHGTEYECVPQCRYVWYLPQCW